MRATGFAPRLDQLARMERDHFWFLGRQVMIDGLLDGHVRAAARVLDIGAGTGSFGGQLAARGHRVVGIDREHAAFAGARAAGAPRASLAHAEAEALPFAAGCFDGAVALDVLEHADDDAGLLREVARVLRPGGWLLVTVPAHAWLWSRRDDDAGHRRRYGARLLGARLRGAGFQVLELRRYQALLFPALIVSRLLGRRGPRLRDLEDRPPAALAMLLRPIARLDARLGLHLHWPVGSTLVAFARRGPRHD